MPRQAQGQAGGRERLLAAARRLFAAKGYAATSIRDIVRAAEVTPPVLYHHFRHKEGVFLAIVEDALSKLEATLEISEDVGDAATRIRRFCRAALAARVENRDLVRVVDGIMAGPPDAAPSFDFRAIAARTVDQLEALVREGVKRGEFRAASPRAAAFLLLGGIDLASRPWIFGSSMQHPERELERMVTLVLQGIARR